MRLAMWSRSASVKVDSVERRIRIDTYPHAPRHDGADGVSEATTRVEGSRLVQSGDDTIETLSLADALGVGGRELGGDLVDQLSATRQEMARADERRVLGLRYLRTECRRHGFESLPLAAQVLGELPGGLHHAIGEERVDDLDVGALDVVQRSQACREQWRS